MDRVTQRLHIDRVVLLVNAGTSHVCRRYGHDHRPAMITKAHKASHPCTSSRYFPRYSGDSGAGRVLAPGRPTQDHLQLITPPSSAHAAAPSYGAESMIEASVSANGASPVDSQFEPIQKPSTAVSFSP